MTLLDEALTGGNLVTGVAIGTLALPPPRGPLIELVAAGAARSSRPSSRLKARRSKPWSRRPSGV